MSGPMSWRDLFGEVAGDFERKCKLALMIDDDVINELIKRVQGTLSGYNLDRPSPAKIAGHLSFWIRKLKPISFDPRCDRKYLAVNEMVGILLGLAICRRFGKGNFALPPARVRSDWVRSLRFHSHSPHSTALMFEMMFRG
ncbi:MAG: hypothetical protein HQL66_13090 [Magnetococcales bacterium]|nr:hypothetical protein [Magnetococcales bacterium]